MWFKNLKFYQLSQSLELDSDTLETRLGEHVFRPCGSQDLASMGWSTPLGKGDALSHQADGKIWLALKRQEKLLPATVVNSQLAEQVTQLEAQNGSPLSKQAKSDLKQEIIQRLLPRAFAKDSFIQGFVSVADNLVVVDAASDGKAELFLAQLRKTLGSLPVLPLCRRSLENELTEWLQKDAVPSDFELLEEAELRSSDEDAAVIRCKNLDLLSDEVMQHIEAGKRIQKVALNWQQSCTMLLEQDLSVKRIKYTDLLMEQNDDIPKDQQDARLDADFALMSGEVVKLAHSLSEIFSLDQQA